MILDKKQMTEEDIKYNFITPAIQSKGWSDKITMETQVKFTDGKINLKGNVVKREPAKKADYILYLNSNNPIAIVEAKDNNHTVSYGLQQAFAYSSNGDGFYEHDFLTGLERQIDLHEFPTVEELSLRVKQEANGGTGLSDAEETIINQP